MRQLPKLKAILPDLSIKNLVPDAPLTLALSLVGERIKQ